jgi:rhodanese-related sulfurtransferase
MKRTILLGTLLALGAGNAQAAPMAGVDRLDVSMSFQWSDEVNDSDPLFQRQFAISHQVTHVTGIDSTITTTHDMAREMQRSRTAQTPILIAPAHVISSGLKNGYELVGVFRGKPEVAVLIGGPGIKTLSDARGKRLLLPGEDGLVTYLILGEFQSRGIDPKKYFSEIRYVRFDQAALHGLDIGAADVAGVSDALLKRMVPPTPGTPAPVRLIESQPVPAEAIAIRADLPAKIKDSLRKGFLQPDRTSPLAEAWGADSVVPAAKAPFGYVGSLGHHTPVVVAGATVVSAQQVRELMVKGATLFDTRIPIEYDEEHIVGAHHLPYTENSRKDPEFDSGVDRFDIAGLPANKAAPVIFQCNGPECWKSYKATVTAVRAGYTRVYWFRGGYPEWRVAGYPLEAGKPSTQTALQ